MKAAASPAEPPETAAPNGPPILIRTRPPSPKRLSRKALMAGAVLAGGIIAFALINGLSERPDRYGGAEQNASAAAGGAPESIRQAPSNYLGTDLPRGVGAFASDADENLAPPTDPIWGDADPGDRSLAERTGDAAQPAADVPDPQVTARTSPILFAMERVRAEGEDSEARLDARLTRPRSRYELQAGHVIPAALVTALNSDSAGRVIAQVTAPVYDSVSGDHLLIPQGARLIGAYENSARYGDNRILLVWNRLILPNGWSINLRNMNASDPEGAAGLSDRTDNHLDRLAAAIGLSAIISVIANESEGDDNDDNSLRESVGEAAAQQAAQTGARIVDRELTVRPTLRVRAGAPVRVLVTRDIQLRPYRQEAQR
ncbi:MAG: hypothetical protein DCF16_16080 [Alphaproteobacteria bacterium]|nr:MAG: hypothetical protein DCF16_16080 [Alphaproteobacteria bacterium]